MGDHFTTGKETNLYHYCLIRLLKMALNSFATTIHIIMSTQTKTSKTVSENAKVETANKVNDFKAKMAEFLAKRDEKAQKLEADKIAKREERTSTIKSLGKEDFLRLQILNAGADGIDVNTLVEVGRTYVNGKGELKPISEITVRHNWNRNGLVQRGEEKLTKSNLPTEEQIGSLEIFYNVDLNESDVKGQKYNNHITLLPFCVEPLKAYLLSNGAIAEMFTTV